MNATETFVSQLIANLAANLAQAETRYAARHGNVFLGSERVAVAKSGTFARKVAYALNQSSQTAAFLKAVESMLLKSGDAAQLAAIRRAVEGDDGRTRIGNTPTCEDCGQPQDHCKCDFEGDAH